MLSVICAESEIRRLAEWHYAECRYAEYHCAINFSNSEQQVFSSESFIP
jgi:hypothetical protein